MYTFAFINFRGEQTSSTDQLWYCVSRCLSFKSDFSAQRARSNVYRSYTHQSQPRGQSGEPSEPLSLDFSAIVVFSICLHASQRSTHGHYVQLQCQSAENESPACQCWFDASSRPLQPLIPPFNSKELQKDRTYSKHSSFTMVYVLLSTPLLNFCYSSASFHNAVK